MWKHRFFGVRLTRSRATILATIVSSVAAAGQASPDLILLNGRIFTGKTEHSFVQALAISGDRISAVGSTTSIAALAGSRTRKIDLGGRTVIAGINDAHVHLGIPPATVEFKSWNPTAQEVRDGVTAAVARRTDGALIYGWISDKAYFDDSLNRDELDRITVRHPVVLFSVSGHACILNSPALKLFKIRESDRDPIGGRYDRAPNGNLTGVLHEYAALGVERQLADAASDEELVKDLRESLAGAPKLAITSVQDMSGALDPERAMRLFELAGTTVRVRVIRMPVSDQSGRHSSEGSGLLGTHRGLTRVSGIKWLLDGTPLEGTFAARGTQREFFKAADNLRSAGKPNPFEEFLFSLQPTVSREQMTLMLGEAARGDEQLMVHVTGYAAAKAMLETMDDSNRSFWTDRRVRFEHGDGLFPDLLMTIKARGIVVVQNPGHLNWTRHFQQKLEFVRAQPLRTLLAAGIPLAFGSDGSGDFEPFRDILLATTHPDRPSEAITREQAIIAYTRTSAYAEFKEKEKGTLEPGKLADLAVLSQDVFSVPESQLPKTESMLTLVGGKVIYDSGVLR